jgi:hypothetical protein
VKSPGLLNIPLAVSAQTVIYNLPGVLYELNGKSDYSAEKRLIVGNGAGNLTAGYRALEGDLTGAIHADQAIFTTAASSGSRSLGPLAGVVIAAAVLMVLGCAWGIARRLAEYR